MQLIWQLFNAVEKGFAASGDTDAAFLQGLSPLRCDDVEGLTGSHMYYLLLYVAEVRDKRARMDKGIHIGSWGQLQGWLFSFFTFAVGSRPWTLRRMES